jgi:hypothetical protein
MPKSGILINQDEKSYAEYFYRLKISLMMIEKESLAKIEHIYPGLTKDTDIFVFMVWLTRTNSRCELTGGIKFPREKLASIKGIHPKNVRLHKFLEEVKEKYLPNLEWFEYSYTEGLCTVIKTTGMEIHFADLVKKINAGGDGTKILIKTLRKMTEKAKRDIAAQMQETLLHMKWDNADQQLIADYLNTRKYSLFKYHFADGIRAAMSIDEHSSVKDYNLNLLMTYTEMPKPFYVPKPRQTDRVFGTELTFLSGEVRKALYPDWIDFDLKNCHLAILASLFAMPVTSAFLSTGKSFWKEIMDYMGIAPEQQAIAKEFIKIALYSIVYGMLASYAKENLEQELAFRAILWNKSFTDHPIVKEISNVIQQAKTKIENKNGMQSAYRFITLGSKDVNSVLSCVIQSYELAIITACYEMAVREEESRNADFDIALHQHDGFSILPKNNVDLVKIEQRFQKVVSKKADDIEIVSMMIEMKEQ